MNRNFVLVSGAIAWALVVGDVVLHLVDGNVFVPVAMAIAGVTWVGVRRHQLRLRTVAAGN